MLKKILSLLLVLTFLLSMMTVTASATTEEYLVSEEARLGYADLIDRSFATIERQQILDEIVVLQNHGVLSAGLEELTSVQKQTVAGLRESAGIHYIIQADNFINDICVTENSEQRLSLRVKQGNLVNTMDFEGETIKINGATISASFASENVFATPAGMARNSETDFLSTCPYGSASAYSTFVCTSGVNEIDLQNSLSAIVYTVFKVAVMAVLSTIPGTVAIMAGQFIDLFSLDASDIYAYLSAQYPSSYGISYKCYQYYHNTCSTTSGGYIAQYGSYVVKCVNHWYGHEDYRGVASLHTSYRVHTIY